MTLFQKLLEWTEATFLPYGGLGIFFLAFIESIFFPLPPDILLIVLSLANPSMSFWYATLATLGSVFGGLTAWYLGYWLGLALLEKIVSKKTVKKAHQMIEEYGVVAIFLGGFTPLPYKVFTWSAGILAMDKKKFVLASFLSRGPRFFLEALFLWRFGAPIVAFLEKHFNLITLAIGMIAVLGFVVWHGQKHYKKRQARKSKD